MEEVTEQKHRLEERVTELVSEVSLRSTELDQMKQECKAALHRWKSSEENGNALKVVLNTHPDSTPCPSL